STKSPVFRGGGRVFGPKPHDYDIDVNKKVKFLAKASVLTDKANNGMVKVVEDFSFEAPNTKEYIKVLNNLQITGKSLMVLENDNPNVYLSGRNVPKSGVVTVKDVNTYEILHADVLIISENAVKKLQQA